MRNTSPNIPLPILRANFSEGLDQFDSNRTTGSPLTCSRPINTFTHVDTLSKTRHKQTLQMKTNLHRAQSKHWSCATSWWEVHMCLGEAKFSMMSLPPLFLHLNKGPSLWGCLTRQPPTPDCCCTSQSPHVLLVERCQSRPSSTELGAHLPAWRGNCGRGGGRGVENAFDWLYR